MRNGQIRICRKSGFIFLLVMAGILYPMIISANTPQQPVDKVSLFRDHLKKGDVFLAEKNYAAAMFEYEKASDIMPDEEQPKLKMQSIEATLGINELAEVKRKVEQAKKLEKEQLEKSRAGATHEVTAPQPEVTKYIRERDQQSKRDSLRKVIFDTYSEELKAAEKGKDMMARSSVYHKIADAFRKVRDEELAISYYTRALEIEEKYGVSKNVSAVYEEMADAYYSSGNFQNSITSYEKSLALKEKSGDKAGASKVLSNIANVYETTYDYKQAIDYYQESAKLKDSIKDESGLKDVMNDLGDVYYKQKVLTSSILSYEKTVNIIQKLNMKQALGPVYNKLGVAHYEMGNYADAEKFFKESLKSLNENGNRKEASMALNNLGNLLFINNKYGDAISYYQRSLTSKKSENYSFGVAVTMYNLGNAYRRSGNQEMAIENYEACKRIADSLNIPSLSAKSCKALSVSYEAFRNFEKAAQLEEELAGMKQPSVSIEIPVSENEMDLEHEKTQEILTKLNEEALKRKDLVEAGADKKMTDMYINNLNGRFMKEQSKTKMLVIVAGSLCFLLIITLIISRRKKKK